MSDSTSTVLSMEDYVDAAPIRVGVIGGRGHTGAALLALIAHHPRLGLAFASSRAHAGQTIDGHAQPDGTPMVFETITAADLETRTADAIVLALPNGAGQPFLDAIDTHHPETVVVDLSADHRFDPTWMYGQPERMGMWLRGARRIANPGCYATGAQLAIGPLVDLLDAPPAVFGVSGYSGAGTTPSPKNDPANLKDNLLPYAPTGHMHEREVSHQLGHAVHFMPHVAPFFRGISLTINLSFAAPQDKAGLMARYTQAYADAPLVHLQDEAPVVRDAALMHHVTIGGLTLSEDGRRAVVYATLDNLLKGAATQAVQNLNLALGLSALSGIPLTAD